MVQRKGEFLKSGWDKTDEERAECFGCVVEAADYSQAEDGCHCQGIGIDREWSPAQGIGACGGEEHRYQLHAGENDGDEEWVVVAGILDCEVASVLGLYERKRHDGDWRVIQKYTAYVLNTDRPTNC